MEPEEHKLNQALALELPSVLENYVGASHQHNPPSSLPTMPLSPCHKAPPHHPPYTP